jgi:hypothetical protein
VTVSDDTRHLSSHAVGGDQRDRRSDLSQYAVSGEQYDEILRLTVQQREAIEGGDLERALTLLARRGPLLEALRVDQDGDREQTRRQAIAELDRASEASLLAWRELVVAELELLQRGKSGLGGYRTGELADAAFIDQTS